MYLGGGIRVLLVLYLFGVVWDVEGGGGLPVRRHSYGARRVQLTMEGRLAKKRPKTTVVTVESHAE